METEKVEMPEIVRDEHLEFLDELRESGVTNMFAGAAFLTEEFGLSGRDAKTVLLYWMNSYSERHPRKEAQP